MKQFIKGVIDVVVVVSIPTISLNISDSWVSGVLSGAALVVYVTVRSFFIE